ncbi:MAG: Hpt domain-containing protein [Magnetococcus sp. DMHC-6]
MDTRLQNNNVFSHTKMIAILSDIKLLDCSILDRIQLTLPAQQVSQLKELFRQSSHQSLTKMAVAYQNADWSTFIKAAHSLVGACENLGLFRLAHLARWIEHSAQNNLWEALPELLNAIGPLQEKSMKALEAWFAQD